MDTKGASQDASSLAQMIHQRVPDFGFELQQIRRACVLAHKAWVGWEVWFQTGTNVRLVRSTGMSPLL